MSNFGTVSETATGESVTGIAIGKMKQHVGLLARRKAPRILLTSLCARRTRPYLNLAPIDKSDRWIEDHLVPALTPLSTSIRVP